MKLTDDEKGLLFFDSFGQLSYSAKQKLLTLYGSPSIAVRSFEKKRSEAVAIIGEEFFVRIASCLNFDYFKALMDRLTNLDVSVTTICSEDYPERLLRLSDPPFCLYYRGNVDLFSLPSVSVVGTRKLSGKGASVVRRFTEGLSSRLTIVSGLAMGADTVAHEAALDSGGKTVAVLCGGVERIYPAENRELYQRILADDGLIVSEQPPASKIMPFQFLIRNRIMAALSDAVLVTYAYERSGTTSTAEAAISCGSELFVIPGDVDSEESVGCNRLIRRYPESLVTCVEDVLERLGYEKATFVTKNDLVKSDDAAEERESESVDDSAASEIDGEIVEYCQNERHFAEICDRFGMDGATASVKLLELEMADKLTRLPLNYFKKIK